MTIFIAIILTVLTFIFIVYPLVRPRRHSTDSARNEHWQALHSERDTIYSMLKELEFDFQSGILTEEDYRELETKYKRKGISILKSIDSLGKSADIETEIEKQILELRRGEGKFYP
ncbi:MAG: c-type cytochrome biogenesis protein CcmI [Dehalococcoidales bacterium]|nr:c-type cytochrome biogenesis protein CcmI [Dehalococcoidales bacterium]MDP7416211.1 c-type cytochrome biogenesis protein CcmI [Dehalococcoidales bacterium]